MNYENNDSMFPPFNGGEWQAPTPPPKKTGKGKWIAAGISLSVVAVAAAIVVCGFLLGWFTPVSPVEKTMQAVFPSFELFDEVMEKSGTVTLDITLGSDIDKAFEDNPMLLFIQMTKSKNAVLLEGSVGTEKNKLNAGLFADQDGMQAYSNLLEEGKGYSVPFEGVMEALDDSPFAPDSGSAYAMDQDAYDMIRSMIEGNGETEEVDEEALAKAINAIVERLTEDLEIEETKESVQLLDTETDATVYSITFDESILVTFADAFLEQWENDEALSDAVRIYIQAMAAQVGDSEESVDEQMEQIDEELTSALEELKENAEEIALDGEIRMAVRSGYLVLLECGYSLVDESAEEGNQQSGIDFSWIFCEDPSENPSFEMRLALIEEEEEVAVLSFDRLQKKTNWKIENTWDLEFFTPGEYNTSALISIESEEKENGNLKWQIGMYSAMSEKEIKSSDYVTVLELDLGGKVVKEKNLFDLTIDSVEISTYEGEILDLEQSVFRFTVKAEDVKAERLADDVALLELSVEELDTLIAGIEEKFQSFIDGVNGELEKELLVKGVTLENGNYIELPDDSDYVLDRETGHLFLFTQNTVVMYDVYTMEVLESIQNVPAVKCADADGGLLAVVYDKNSESRRNVQIYDAETLDEVKTLDLQNLTQTGSLQSKISDLVLDGDNLIVAYYNDLYFVDIDSETFTKPDTSYSDYLAIDRENRILAICEADHDAPIELYDLQEGKTVAAFKELHEFSDHIYFDGSSFSVGDMHYQTDGTSSSDATFVKERKNADRAPVLVDVIWKDDQMIIVLESNSEYQFTKVYDVEGNAIEKIGWLITGMEKIGDEDYLTVVYDGNGYYLMHYRITYGWILNGYAE